MRKDGGPKIDVQCGHSGVANTENPSQVLGLGHTQKYAKMASPVIFGMSQNGLCVLKLYLSGASIAVNFNRHKRMES